MIAQLYGIPVQTGDKWAVLDVGGVGYRVYLPKLSLDELSLSGERPVRVYTNMVVREDSVSLYGSIHQNEVEMFSVLISVSGIGPQTALNIISQISTEEFAFAILNDDEKVLTRISGIGPKSAKRLILELRDKMKRISETIASPDSGTKIPVINDAVSALLSLGFQEKESRTAVETIASSSGDISLQELIRDSLAKLKEY
ncbi:Holliday junction branch migration protein RuvA [Methanoplanus limicola]|uniref:Holliday junction DNA helicase subunit RuvA n=1 Tax=Methanoplanus limicola DSM 2279 TaxID=937775 RepID=H1YZN4_9EURY|nr:Holliday junction branch migration protein RuvA [Methanoplanus limicola]EHQ37087.1 Holliday junction DNA helicase subunit RuvA [Methanoplanus limicola DSM 2279]